MNAALLHTKMASSTAFAVLFSPPNPNPNPNPIPSISPSSTTRQTLIFPKRINTKSTIFSTRKRSFSIVAAAAARELQALVFDCDGVILESEHLHRQAYNDAFSHFNVRCTTDETLNWGVEFYDHLQNLIGGGKPKMRWYFKEYGWPISTVSDTPPENDDDREKLIDIIQDWKTERYKEIIKSGMVKPRPGVLRLMDEAKASGKKLAVCSAATKSSVILCLENLIGIERFQGLDCFLAGDDVKQKKPDPSIYVTAAKKLGVSEGNCLVVEDSVIGLQAATGAGMSCIITYTSSTANQNFTDAIAIYPDLSDISLQDLEALLQSVLIAN